MLIHLEQALILLSESETVPDRQLLQATSTIFIFGTPHDGMRGSILRHDRGPAE